jgi:hypothetical protein
MRALILLPFLFASVSQAQADDACMAQCGVAFDHCVMHAGPGNDWALEVCGESLMQCEKRCNETPVVSLFEEPVASETDAGAVAKKK